MQNADSHDINVRLAVLETQMQQRAFMKSSLFLLLFAFVVTAKIMLLLDAYAGSWLLAPFPSWLQFQLGPFYTTAFILGACLFVGAIAHLAGGMLANTLPMREVQTHFAMKQRVDWMVLTAGMFAIISLSLYLSDESQVAAYGVGLVASLFIGIAYGEGVSAGMRRLQHQFLVEQQINLDDKAAD